MRKVKLFLSISAVAAIGLFVASCNKHNEYPVITPAAQAHFMNVKTGTYTIANDASSVFKIPVGVTNVASAARTITFTITSPTNAAAGTQYTLPSSTVTIAAGSAVDTLQVKGIYAGYTSTRVDTLTFTINTANGVAASDYNSVYKLIMRR